MYLTLGASRIVICQMLMSKLVQCLFFLVYMNCKWGLSNEMWVWNGAPNLDEGYWPVPRVFFFSLKTIPSASQVQRHLVRCINVIWRQRSSSIIDCWGKITDANLVPISIAYLYAPALAAPVAALVNARHGWDEMQLRGPNYSGQLSAILIESEHFRTEGTRLTTLQIC